jgi:hypothetical protein
VAEWSKAHAWKVCRRGTVSRVRIPIDPPFTFEIIGLVFDFAAMPAFEAALDCNRLQQNLSAFSALLHKINGTDWECWSVFFLWSPYDALRFSAGRQQKGERGPVI